MEKQPAQIPYYVHEGEMWRQERKAKRLAIACGIIAAALVASNAAWIIHFIG